MGFANLFLIYNQDRGEGFVNYDGSMNDIYDEYFSIDFLNAMFYSYSIGLQNFEVDNFAGDTKY